MTRPKHMVFSHDYSLNFMTDEEYEAYVQEYAALVAKHKQILREKYGFWAANQGKYVATRKELNPFDGEG